MNKSKVCVKLTRKNPKRVFWILEMFGEKVFHSTRLILKDGNHLIEGYPFVYWNGHYWLGCEDDTGKTLVKPRELRNILAKEYLKKGDVCVFGVGDEEEVRVLSKVDDSVYPFESRDKGYTESYSNFLRYATEQEKALLDPKQTIDTVDLVNTFTGSIPGKKTYTHEVWVNHYSDMEFHVHKKKSTANHLCHLNGDLGRHVKTVKATLTYDIPMTKV